jgi:3-oxoacyl-[acyl-carrier-protein] synthase III
VTLGSGVTLRGPETWLPSARYTAHQARRRTDITQDVDALGYVSLTVETSLSAPEMAVRSARRTLQSAAVDPSTLDGLLHAWIHYQGHDLWSPAHYVAHQIGATSAVPLGIQQVCNGGAAAIALASVQVSAGVSPSVLVTTADRFDEAGFDRWKSDYAIAYGDGAASVLLTSDSPRPGDFLLLSITQRAVSHLEQMHRDEDAFAVLPRQHGQVISMRRTKKAFLERNGTKTFIQAGADAVHDVLSRCLSQADVEPSDSRIKEVALPRLGRQVLKDMYQPAVREVMTASCRDYGRETGHLGAGDALANLATMAKDPARQAGDLAMVLTAGAGFTWSCLLVEYT